MALVECSVCSWADDHMGGVLQIRGDAAGSEFQELAIGIAGRVGGAEHGSVLLEYWPIGGGQIRVHRQYLDDFFGHSGHTLAWGEIVRVTSAGNCRSASGLADADGSRNRWIGRRMEMGVGSIAGCHPCGDGGRSHPATNAHRIQWNNFCITVHLWVAALRATCMASHQRTWQHGFPLDHHGRCYGGSWPIGDD